MAKRTNNVNAIKYYEINDMKKYIDSRGMLNVYENVWEKSIISVLSFSLCLLFLLIFSVGFVRSSPLFNHLIWYKIKKVKKGKNGILYRTKAPKLEVLKPTPNPKIMVNRIQKIRKASSLIDLSSDMGFEITTHITKTIKSVFSIPDNIIVGDPVSVI